MKRTELEQIIKGIAPVIKDYIAKALEERAPIEWTGTWNASTSYKRGQLAMWDGSSWIASVDNRGIEPGKSSTGQWRLFASRGKQGSQGPAGKDLR